MSLLTMMQAAASAAPAFDAESATRAYLATLSGAARAKSDAYFEGGYWLPLWGASVAILAYWLMLQLGWSASLISCRRSVPSGLMTQMAFAATPGFCRPKAMRLRETDQLGWVS